jgi:plasmid stability protein
MAQFIVRNLEDDVKTRLKQRLVPDGDDRAIAEAE